MAKAKDDEKKKDERAERAAANAALTAASSEGETKGPKPRVQPVNRLSHRRGHGTFGPVCVVTKDGKHVRLPRVKAIAAVAEGGRYIPKHQFKGQIRLPSGELGTPDWSGKNTKGKPKTKPKADAKAEKTEKTAEKSATTGPAATAKA